MHFAVAVAEVHVDGFPFELFQVGGASVGKDHVADVNVGPHARIVAFVNETGHGANAIEQAEAEGFQFQSNVYVFPVGVIAEAAAAFKTPLPL